VNSRFSAGVEVDNHLGKKLHLHRLGGRLVEFSYVLVKFSYVQYVFSYVHQIKYVFRTDSFGFSEPVELWWQLGE
jgi:hypothetical protein